MPETILILTGRDADVRAARAEIAERWPDLDLSEPAPGQDEEDALAPLGMEPLTYFAIAFGAHFTAGLAHDALKAALRAIAQGHRLKTEEAANPAAAPPPEA